MLDRAALLRNYKLSEILELKFVSHDKHHHGTINEWVVTYAAPQLRTYVKSKEVTQPVLDEGLEMQAHLVLIVGSRHILLWDMDKDGNLADKPRLVGMTSTWDRDKMRIGS
jgi:hypothetical protein